MSWKNLIDIALLGTDKKTLDVRVLPEGIAEFLELRHAQSPELKLLEAAALTYFYETSGKLPPKFEGEWNDAIIEETKAVAPEEYLALFGRIQLTDYQIREKLLNLWLDVLIKKDQIINSDRVTQLLTEGSGLAIQTKDKILSVIGNKGQWALSLTPEYNYKKQTLDLSLWHEGTSQERKNLFTGLRRTDPGKAMELLQSTWATESIVNKRSFLDVVLETSSAADIPFAEALMAGEFAHTAKEKKTEKECRKLLASLLLKYPVSALYQTTTAQLTPYFAMEKKGLTGWVSGKQKVTLTLPEQDDAFWNAKHMDETFGLDVKGIDSAWFQYPSLFWMSHFLEFIPRDFWITFFNNNTADWVQYFLERETFRVTISGRKESIYKQALLGNLQTHRDTTLARPLLWDMPVTEMLDYFKYMHPDDFEALIEKYGYYGDADVLASGPYGPELSWTLLFSQKVVEKAYHQATQSFPNAMLGKVIAQFADKKVHGDLLRYHEKIKGSNAYDLWNRVIFEPAHHALEIRIRIDDYKLNAS
ncbi:DUF5691 domain-containing protein [Chryseolinea lacunae]|uniref:Uncharacterized protein n=1 Tax=Chryseolinea lacunae TaxID=2801331 RepID=A0ABS1KW44_9BACT|nr:DUF5691 domain-containing protein [Chryseolinea lacunae]MBL0743686.1 hypothetical protein [Chryseolinea lacunae]